MEIVQERNYSTLIGEFTAIEYEGDIVNVIIFKDKRYGDFAIGIYKSEIVEFNVPYLITVALRGKVKNANNKIYTSNCLYLVSYEQQSTRAQTKTDQLKGDN